MTVLWNRPGSLGFGTVRDQGEELAPTIDYEWLSTDAVIELAAEAGEPLTVGGETAGVSNFSGVLAALLERRLGFAAADYVDRLGQMLAGPVVGWWGRRQPGREAVGAFLKSAGGYAAQAADGRVVFDALVPPLAPSPRDGACLDMTGFLQWNTGGPILTGGDLTFAGWFKSLSFGSSPVALVAVEDSATGRNATFQLNPGQRSLSLFRTEATGGAVSLPFDDPVAWWFLAVVHDTAAQVVKFYAAQQGQSLTLRSTVAASHLPSGSAMDTFFTGGGSSRGSAFEPQVWDGVRSLAQLQAVMDAAPVGNESGLAFYAPLDGDGAASLEDTVSGASPVVVGSIRQVPDLVLDLRGTPSGIQTRKLRPAKRIDVAYQQNYRPLSPSEVAGTVSQEDALELQRERRTVPWDSVEIAADYEDARELQVPGEGVPTIWYDEDGALAAQRLLRVQQRPGAVFGTLAGVERVGVPVQVGHEVRVYSDRRGGEDGPVYRVLRNRSQLLDLLTDFELWRP